MQNQNTFSFLAEPETIEKWLNTLNLNNPIQSSSEIYTVLKELIKSPDQYQDYLSLILDRITPITIQLSLALQTLFCTSENVLDAKKRKIARLSINSLRYLAFLYSQLSQANEKNLHINISRCLQICQLCFMQNTLLYDRPSTELWKLVGKLYQQASNKGLLETEINESITFFKQQNTISLSVNKLLSFSLCSPYLLSQSEILRLNQFLDQQLEKINLSNTHTPNYSNFWNYNSEFGVQPYSANKQTYLSTVFIDSELLIPQLIENQFASIANKIVTHPTPILALKQSRPVRKKVAFSFSVIVGIIEQNARTAKINKTSVQHLSIIDKLELQPFDHEQKKAKAITADDIWQKEKAVNFFAEGFVKESPQLDFTLIELQSFDGAANELMVIYDGQSLPQLGIIREVILVHNENHHYQLVVEKISNTAKVVAIETDKKQGKALLCTFSKTSPLLIVAPDKFTTGTSIQIAKTSYQLSRLIENTAAFMMYQIQED